MCQISPFRLNKINSFFFPFFFFDCGEMIIVTNYNHDYVGSNHKTVENSTVPLGFQNPGYMAAS